MTKEESQLKYNLRNDSLPLLRNLDLSGWQL
jgi:hypothetical protein